jgi:methionine-rich copper-binding protein CopC
LSISGKTLTINPSSDFSTDTTYKIVFDAGAIVDLNDNKYIQSNDYQFTTIDTIPPTGVGFTPNDDATEIAIASDITITFSEAIKVGTGNITLKKSDGSVVETYDAASSTNLSTSDKTLTINPSEDLDTDTTYEVVFDEGAITDLNDNDYKQSGDYQFTTIETIPPTASSFSPNDDAIQVAVASDITITFSEAIKAGTGNITLKTSDGTVVVAYDAATSSNLSISNKTLTINPTSDLSTDTTYEVVFDEGAIVDINDNDYKQSGGYQFTTIDTISPNATGFSPTDDATEVVVASDIIFTFSEPIKLSSSYIRLLQSDGTFVERFSKSGSNFSIADKTLTLKPTNNLSTDTTYKVVFDAGIVIDLNDNKYTQGSDYQFTTVDTISPKLTSINSAQIYSSDASRNIGLSFDEPIKAGTGTVTFKDIVTGTSQTYDIETSDKIEVTGNKINIGPPADLDSANPHEVIFSKGAITDSAGNKYEPLTLYYGGSADDKVSGESGKDYISGGAGTDTVEYSHDRDDYLISKNPQDNRIEVANKKGESLGYVLDDTELLSFRDVDLDTDTISYIGKFSSVDASANSPFFRFYNPIAKTYFYTATVSEKDNILNKSSVDRNNIDEWPYAFQGSTFNAASTEGSNTKVLVRFLNEITNHHVWSMDANEIANIKNNLPEYKQEGPAGFVYTSDPDPSDPNIGEEVWRYYNPDTRRHFWTADTEERNLIKLTGVWIEEGVAFWGE